MIGAVVQYLANQTPALKGGGTPGVAESGPLL